MVQCHRYCRIGKATNVEEKKYDSLHTQLTVIWKAWSVVLIFTIRYSAGRQRALLQAVYVRHILIQCAQSVSFPRQSFFTDGFINLYLLSHHL